jgi:hypothetical protein
LSHNIFSLLEVDRCLLDLLLLDVNGAGNQVRIGKCLVQFIALKVVDNVLD